MTPKQLQNGYKSDVDQIREDIKLINEQLAVARRENNQTLRELLLEDRRELHTKEQCLVQVIHDLDEVTN